MSYPALLDDGTTAAQLEHIRQARVWLATCYDPQDIADLAERAEFAQKVLKLTRELEVVAREALRLQCEALRKVGQLGELLALPKRLRPPARWMAELTDEQFELLISECDPWVGATTLHYNGRTPEENRSARRRALRRAMAGHLREPVPSEPRDLMSAARMVVAHIAESVDSVTTTKAALALAERLDIPAANVDEVAMQGLRDVVRVAFAQERDVEAIEIAGREIRCPKFVTYQEAELGWVRIPWHRASLGQLQFMAEYRGRQLAELADASMELNLLVAEAQRRQQERPWTDQLAEIFRDVPTTMAATT